jgi:hypothetical protein
MTTKSNKREHDHRFSAITAQHTTGRLALEG